MRRFLGVGRIYDGGDGSLVGERGSVYAEMCNERECEWLCELSSRTVFVIQRQ